MKFAALLPYYFAWHYTTALRELFRIWKNFLWFSLHYFSVKILILTFFRPFFNLKEKNSITDIEKESKIVTFLMFFVGLILRVLSIATGIIAWCSFFVGGFLAIVFWFLLPFLMFFLFIAGMAAILSFQT